MSTPHEFDREIYEWSKVPGATKEDAVTWFKCRRCKKGFAHRYNIEPNLYKAAADEGFDLSVCAGSVDEN